MTFTELRREIEATYPDRSRRFVALAVRYWLGIDKPADLARVAAPMPCLSGRRGDYEVPPHLTADELQTIINNR